MVNIGYRSDGIISRDELSNNPDMKPSDLFKHSDMINVFIMKMDDGDGNVVLSYKRVESLKVWDEVEELFNSRRRVTVTVKSVVKGGLTADLNGLNAFIPTSHASVRFQRDLSKYVGKEMTCEIIDFDKFIEKNSFFLEKCRIRKNLKKQTKFTQLLSRRYCRRYGSKTY